jgi:hypothetical protein
MSAIQLRSASGKWKYKTTTDDPLFASVIGSMVEEGMTLGKELVLPGALGEALEKEWKYIKILQEWIDWEKRVIEGLQDKTIERPVDLVKSNVDVVVAGGFPPPTLWLHDIHVISRALTLPIGWEAYTATDSRISLTERVHHMKASQKYIVENGLMLRGVQDTVTYDAEELISHVYEQSSHVDITNKNGVVLPYYVYLLAAFARNVWLINRRKTPNPKIGTTAWKAVTLYTFLDMLDWEAILPYLTPYAGKSEEIDKTLRLAATMTGTLPRMPTRSDEVEEYDRPLLLKRSRKGISSYSRDEENIDYIMKYSSRKKQAEYIDSHLSRVYLRLLEYLPDDVSIERMGLEVIVGEKKPKWDTDFYMVNIRSYVDISELVAWVHSTMLTYLKSEKKIGDKSSVKRELITLDVDDFPVAVQLISDVLGEYVLGRILLSLLHYLESNEDKSGRVNKFAELIEKKIA